MPHKLLVALEVYLASSDTALGNGNDWGLVQKWLLVAAHKNGGNGDRTRLKLYIAFKMDAILMNDDLIHCWISDCLDATLGRRPDPTSASTAVGIQGNMAVVQNAVVQNMSGIIATEISQGFGVAMQNVTRAGPANAGGAEASEDAKPYTQDQITTLLGFHGAMNVGYLKKVWRLFKATKMPNYDNVHWFIKAKMLRWADRQWCWIEEGVYFDNKSLNEWIALKFNPGDSTALYLSADKGIYILKCCAPTSAHLEELCCQEEI
jgi:hypothetical protein